MGTSPNERAIHSCKILPSMNIQHALACALWLTSATTLLAQEKKVPPLPGDTSSGQTPSNGSKTRFTLTEAISAARANNPEMLAL
jgi:hypothetical protein